MARMRKKTGGWRGEESEGSGDGKAGRTDE